VAAVGAERPVSVRAVDGGGREVAATARERVIQFGPFKANLETCELWRNGQRVPIQRQPFRILQVLLEHSGHLVSREQLKECLWTQDTFVAFDRGLTSAMRKLREALGERADAPTYIETLPGRGYRFIGRLVSPNDIPVIAPRRLQAAAHVALAVLIGITSIHLQPGSSVDAATRLAAAEELSAFACALKAEGRFEEGLKVIERAHALAPESARITAEVGLHLHANKRYDDEMPMLLAAVTQDGQSVDAWLHLGLGYARRDQFAAAIPALERAAALAPGHDRATYWLRWAREQGRRATPQVTGTSASS